MLDTLVRQLGEELDMQDLISSPVPGHFKIPLNGDIQVELIQFPQSYLFKSIIGPSPSNNPEAFFLKAMQANLFGRGTRGASIGLDSEGNVLTLSFELDYNSSYKDFRERMEDFVSTVDFWRKEALK